MAFRARAERAHMAHAEHALNMRRITAAGSGGGGVHLMLEVGDLVSDDPGQLVRRPDKRIVQLRHPPSSSAASSGTAITSTSNCAAWLGGAPAARTPQSSHPAPTGPTASCGQRQLDSVL